MFKLTQNIRFTSTRPAKGHVSHVGMEKSDTHLEEMRGGGRGSSCRDTVGSSPQDGTHLLEAQFAGALGN